MKSISILKIKLSGIIGCIKEYSGDPAIISVLGALKDALSENNYEVILYACQEISSWYAANLGAILDNHYVCNQESHIKNSKEIQGIVNDLENTLIENKSTSNTSGHNITKKNPPDAHTFFAVILIKSFIFDFETYLIGKFAPSFIRITHWTLFLLVF